MEKEMMSGNIKAYNTLKALSKAQQPKSAVSEDINENVLTKHGCSELGD